MEYLPDMQLLALQGKGAAAVLAKLAPSLNLKTMPFMTGTAATVAGIKGCRVTRCGYTGEDGFEIAVDPKNAVALAEVLLKVCLSMFNFSILVKGRIYHENDHNKQYRLLDAPQGPGCQALWPGGA